MSLLKNYHLEITYSSPNERFCQIFSDFFYKSLIFKYIYIDDSIYLERNYNSCCLVDVIYWETIRRSKEESHCKGRIREKQ